MLVETALPEQRQLLDQSGGSRAFPLTLQPRSPMAAAQLAQWTQSNDAYLRHLAMLHGAVLIRGCNVKSAQDFAEVADSLNCARYEYIGGTALRTELVPGLVFTANEAPPDQQIAFHHETSMAPEPPTYVLFFCETPPAEGGATPIVHSEEVATFLETTHPEFAKKVALLGVRYIRVMPEETDRSSFFGRSWKSCYKASTRSEAEEAMTKQGTLYEWLPNGDCRTTTKVCPGFRLDPRTGKRAFFNSVYGVFTGWNNARNSGEKSVVFGDGSPIDADVMHSLGCFIKERQVAFKWKHGDVLLIDNALVMHSRQAFKPPRQILASLCGKPNVPLAKATQGGTELSSMFFVVGKEAGLVRDDLPIWGLKPEVPVEEVFPLSSGSAVEKHAVAGVRGAFQLLNLLSREEFTT